MRVLSAQGRLHRERIFHRGPLRRSIEAGGSVAVGEDDDESALQGGDVFPQFFVGFGDISRGKGALKLLRFGNRLRFGSRILAGVVIEQGRHGGGIGPHFFDRLRKPFIDGAIHQSVGKPEHGNHGQEREQKTNDDETRAELGSGHAGATLGVELEQIAGEND
jgi:hypothetical protein